METLRPSAVAPPRLDRIADQSIRSFARLVAVCLACVVVFLSASCSAQTRPAVPPPSARALTPIARWDVVPNQRITRGEVLNVGVVAFSKAGIDRVAFTVTGQGYSGASPISVSTMTYNAQTRVHEYWFPLDANRFSSDGVFAIRAEVRGGDGGVRALDTLSLVVNATGDLPAPKAWVSTTGDDTAGRVNNRSLPFQTPAAAVAAVQSANGRSSDGATICFFEGNYALTGMKASTANEWLTLTRDQDARRDHTRLTGPSSGSVDTRLLRIKGMTLPSTGATRWLAKRPDALWIDGSAVRGPGRWVASSNPTRRGTDTDTETAYFTDTEMYDVDYGINMARLARNVTVKRVGNDSFVNTACIINAVVEDVDPGDTFWHADGYQSWGRGPQNRIIYGFHAMNLHYQGLFMRQEPNSPARNNAFVNVFMEMRKPGRPGRKGGAPVLNAGTLNGAWDHLLIWNCSFLGAAFTVYDDPAGTPLSFRNCSFLGNVFDQFIDYDQKTEGHDPAYSLPGNPGNNEFLHNHYNYSAVDTGGGSALPPHWRSRSPDSGAAPTQTIGDARVHLSPSSPIGSFGGPLAGSALLNRIAKPLVPVDALGRLRGASSDVGAMERQEDREAREPETAPKGAKTRAPVVPRANLKGPNP